MGWIRGSHLWIKAKSEYAASLEPLEKGKYWQIYQAFGSPSKAYKVAKIAKSPPKPGDKLTGIAGWRRTRI